MKTKKDNLTDLVDDLTQPEPQEGQAKQPEGLNNYQVVTADGEVIDLGIPVYPPMIRKTKEGTVTKLMLGGYDKDGNQYVLIVDKKSA